MADVTPLLVGLRLDGRPVTVVGDTAGIVRRVRDLRRSGAVVLVVCEDETAAGAVETDGSPVQRRQWRRQDFTGSLLAVIDLADGPGEAVEAARGAGCLVYVPDIPELSDIVMTAVVRRGPLQLAVSTSGRSPAAARHLGELVDQWLPATTAATLSAMAEIRAAMRATGTSLPRYDQWAAAMDAGLDAGDAGEAGAAVARTLGWGGSG